MPKANVVWEVQKEWGVQNEPIATIYSQWLLNFLKNFVPVLEPLIKSWFGVTATQMSIFILFVNAGVLFEGAFSL